MNGGWLGHAILRAASLLAPAERRVEWLDEWRSELWYIPRRGATVFCLGAFRDALWVRRNHASPVKRIRTRLESPLRCLAWLAMLAAVSSLIAILLPGPRGGPWPAHLRIRDLPGGSILMLLLTPLLLPAARIALGQAPAHRHPIPWPNRLRRGIFLALKIALLQPILFGGLVVLIATARVAPIASQFGICALWILTLRWALVDQRRRCPICLRLLVNPVRIGTSSQTFLEWYGAESVCSRGHGLLHLSDASANYSGTSEWLALDDSWSSLFSDAAGVRQR